MSDVARIAPEIDLPIYRQSRFEVDDAAFFLTATASGKRLGVLAPQTSPRLAAFSGERQERADWALLLCPLSHANAAALRAVSPWLQPTPLGLATSAGCGDRLGLATPGHVAAARTVGGIAMIFAQQSVRELARTARTPDQVLDDATWGLVQEGWQEASGADADHLKVPADIERFAAAGFSFYTMDPGEHVDSSADSDDQSLVAAKYAALPWAELATTAHDLRAAYVGKQFDVDDRVIVFDEETLMRAAVKYGRAVAHVTKMFRHLLSIRQEQTCEMEISVDETATPTSHAEHLLIARELRRLGVRWVSLAPRYVGRFEKGVDYIGDLAAFRADFAGHAAIARTLGPYKLSLHSGSDKFSIYAIAAEEAHGLLHLKTAGTSLLEALRATAHFDPELFRDILSFSIERYAIDKASYHVSADLSRIPDQAAVADAQLPELLNHFDARQVLHVTFGSMLSNSYGFKARLTAGLTSHEEIHYKGLERHFVRHLAPLRSWDRVG